MKKRDIVKKKIEFNDIIKTGKSVKSKEFIVYYKENNLKYDRFGITVGTKLGNAVFRNKYKRKIRSIVDEYMKIEKESNDYIILLRKEGSNATYSELKTSFLKLMTKI